MPPVHKKSEPRDRPHGPAPRPAPSPPRPAEPTRASESPRKVSVSPRGPEPRKEDRKPSERPREAPHAHSASRPTAQKHGEHPAQAKESKPKATQKKAKLEKAKKTEARDSPRAAPSFWITVGATFFTGASGACSRLDDGRFYYAELGTANRVNGAATGHGWIARAFGMPGELPCGAGLWVRYGGRTTYMIKGDRGYGQGGDGYTSDPHYAVDLHDEVARYLHFPGKGDIEISPNFKTPHGGATRTDTGAVPLYVNPLAKARVKPERIDQGVDYAGTGDLVAIAKGVVTQVRTGDTGWPGNFIEYKIEQDGELNGAYVYYAEGVTPRVSVGDRLVAGQTVCSLIPGWHSGIEIGFAAGNGEDISYYAYHDGAYPGSGSTRPGIAFSRLIQKLGGPGGIQQDPILGKWPEYVPNGQLSTTVLPGPSTTNPAFFGVSPTGASDFAQQYDWGGSVKHKWKELHDGISRGASHVHSVRTWADQHEYVKPAP